MMKKRRSLNYLNLFHCREENSENLVKYYTGIIIIQLGPMYFTLFTVAGLIKKEAFQRSL